MPVGWFEEEQNANEAPAEEPAQPEVATTTTTPATTTFQVTTTTAAPLETEAAAEILSTLPAETSQLAEESEAPVTTTVGSISEAADQVFSFIDSSVVGVVVVQSFPDIISHE
jgi:hypothetical protein